MSNEIAKATQKKGLAAIMAERFCMEPAMFVETIKKTVMPSTATNEEVAAFLMVAKEYSLNPILKEIHAFPKKGGGIQPIVGVDGWAKIITRHPDFDGMDFTYDDTDKSVTCKIYRKSHAHPVTVTEYLDECFRPTEPWKTMPKRMLRHKALMQCGRIAFGLSGIMDEDEARDIRAVDATVVDDDPLKPGRTQRRKIATSEPAPEVTPEEKPEVRCASWEDYQDAIATNPDGVQKAIERAKKEYPKTCGKLSCVEDLDPMDQAQVSTVLGLVE